jgi:DNA-binding transcriptional LysR family regulator
MLNLHELNVFVEAAQAENFSAAARRLYLSQPAVSLHVRNLEQQLGVELFQRNGRNIALSAAGKVLLPLARQILRDAKRLEETMASLHGKVIGQLPIACSTTVGKYVLPRLVAGFRARYPDVAVEISVMSRRAAVERLLEGRAEIAVVSTQLSHHDLEFAAFLTDEVVLIAPPDHPWADGRIVQPQALPTMPIIVREETAGTYEVLAEGLAAHGLNIEQLQVVLTLANAEAIEMSVEAGIGVAFVSRLAAARGLALGKVVQVPVEGMKLTRTIYMVRHQRRPSTPLQQAFWDFAFDPINEPIRQLPME